MKDATEIVVVLDKSGSMWSKVSDTIGGYNQFLEDQKKSGKEANLTLILFDTDYAVRPSVPISTAELLSDVTYIPAGGTALIDAMARAINETGGRLSALKENDRPNKVIIVTITDGEENSSKEYTREALKKMIDVQQNVYKWVFLYLSANVMEFDEMKWSENIDAMGIHPCHGWTGLVGPQLYRNASKAVFSYQQTGTVSCDWKDS